MACTFKRRNPELSVAKHIQGFWQMQNDEQLQFLNLVPDAYFECFFVLSGQVLIQLPHQTYYERLPQAGIIGQLSQSVPFILGPGARILSVKLFPWTPSKIFTIPIHLYSHRITDLESAGAHPTFRQMARDLLSMETFDEQVCFLNRFFCSWFQKGDTSSPFLQFAVERLFESKGSLRIDSLGGSVHASSRYIQKLFRDQVGLSPKQFAKVIRVKKASIQLQNQSFKGSINQISANLGYFDQSHFLKDFKSIVGQSPTEFISNQEYFELQGIQDYLQQWDYS